MDILDDEDGWNDDRKHSEATGSDSVCFGMFQKDLEFYYFYFENGVVWFFDFGFIWDGEEGRGGWEFIGGGKAAGTAAEHEY